MTFDAAMIEQHGLQTITPVIVTNASSYAEVLTTNTGTVEADTELLTIVK
ncbi:phosphotransferase system IIA component [Exiguobacterium sp. PvP048]